MIINNLNILKIKFNILSLLIVKIFNRITETIERQILQPYPIRDCTSEELEIMLDVTKVSDTNQIIKLSKDCNGKYSSYSICLPFKLITQERALHLSLFLDEFFNVMNQILKEFQIPEVVVFGAKEIIKKEIEDIPIYNYSTNQQEINWLKSIKELHKQEHVLLE